MKSVYLSGPITGLSYNNAKGAIHRPVGFSGELSRTTLPKPWPTMLSGQAKGMGSPERPGHESRPNAKLWRNEVIEELLHHDIEGICPMRDKVYLEGEEVLAGQYPQAMSQRAAIYSRDMFDVKQCDAVLCNLIGAEAVSIGTVAEINVARMLGKPVVLAMEEHGNVHDHAFVVQCCAPWVHSLEDAVDVIKHMLGPSRVSGPRREYT